MGARGARGALGALGLPRRSGVAAKAGASVLAMALLCSSLWAQGRGGVASFPAQQRDPADPAVVARGRAIYDTECRSCHGADLRGGEQGGSNLLRVTLVLNDREGELIQPVLQGSHKGRISAAGLSADEVKALAAYVHSVLALAPGQGAPPPPVAPPELKVLVGDAAAGERYFAARCAGCHSVTGDLKASVRGTWSGSASESLDCRRTRRRRPRWARCRARYTGAADDHAARNKGCRDAAFGTEV